MMKIAILDWPTTVAHASFAAFHRALAQALQGLGHRVAVFHDAGAMLRAARTGRWDCSLAIGSHYRFHDGATPLYERLGLPHFQWIVDTPFKARLADPPHPLLRAIVIDREFAGRAAVPLEHTLFLPLGADLDPAPAPSARRYDLVFTGQVKDPDQDWRALAGLPPAPRALAERLVERMVAAPDASLLQGFDAERQACPLPADEEAQAFLAANSFLRSWKRRRVMLALRGLPVHVFGEVRDPRCLAAPNLQVHGAFPYHRLGEILGASRVALNVTPNFHAACHDRIVAALACGALAATDTNPWLERQFADGREILAYRHAALDELAPRIADALAGGRWAALAAAGRRVVDERFTWTRTAQRLAPHLRTAAAEMNNLYESPA